MARPESDRPSPVALAYAQSMLDLANEQKQAESLGRELADLKKVLDETPAAKEMFSNPAVSVDERTQINPRRGR